MKQNLLNDKNYTIRFFNDYWDFYERDGKKYYLLIIENDNCNTRTSKFIRASNNRELRLITDMIRNDRLLVINYLMNHSKKMIDDFLNEIKLVVNDFFENTDINF